MSLSYFPLYADDFEADTAHLTLAEDGAYNRLLRLCWRTPGCSIPAEKGWIYRRLRCLTDEDRAVVDAVLDEFFIENKGRLSNARLSKEWLAANEAHEKRKKAGAKGGKAKPLTKKEKGSSNAKAKPKQPEPEPEPDIEDDADGARARALEADPDPPSDACCNNHQAETPVDTWRETLCRAMGLDPQGITPGGRIAGTQADMAEAQRWQHDLGLSKMQILRQVREVMGKKADGPPKSFRYFTPAMQRLASDLAAPRLEPAPQHQQPNGGFYDADTGKYVNGNSTRPPNRSDPALEQIARLTGLHQASGDGGS